MDTITISPAYGKDYKSKAEAEQAFRNGVDFTNHTMGVRGKYITIRNCNQGDRVELRYKRLTAVHLFTI